MKFILPFPPHILSPNSNAGWQERLKHKKAMRQAGIDSTKGFNKNLGNGRIAMKVVFYPRSMRMDMDNMLSASKALIDGLATGLGVNDKQFRPILLDCHCADKVTPRVEITLYKKNEKKVHN